MNVSCIRIVLCVLLKYILKSKPGGGGVINNGICVLNCAEICSLKTDRAGKTSISGLRRYCPFAGFWMSLSRPTAAAPHVRGASRTIRKCPCKHPAAKVRYCYTLYVCKGAFLTDTNNNRGITGERADGWKRSNIPGNKYGDMYRVLMTTVTAAACVVRKYMDYYILVFSKTGRAFTQKFASKVRENLGVITYGRRGKGTTPDRNLEGVERFENRMLHLVRILKKKRKGDDQFGLHYVYRRTFYILSVRPLGRPTTSITPPVLYVFVNRN